MEEADEVAEGRAEAGDAAEGGDSGSGVALGPEHGGVDVGVEEEHDNCGDGEEDGDDDEVAEAEVVDGCPPARWSRRHCCGRW